METIIKESPTLKEDVMSNKQIGDDYEPILLDSGLTNGDYPVGELGALAPHCKALSAYAAEHETLPAQCLLSALSLATQALYQVKYLPGVRPAPTSLYLLSIGVSGQRKTTCFNPALQAVYRCEKERAGVYEREKEAYKANQRKKKDDQVAMFEPDMAWLVVRDPTISGIMQTFGQGSQSLGLFNDDAGNFLEGAAMGREDQVSTMAALNHSWGDGLWETTRAKHGGTWKLFNRWLSIHLMAQPEMVESLLSDKKAKGSGYLSRFLIASPKSTIGTKEAIIPFKQAMEAEKKGEFKLVEFNRVIARLLDSEAPAEKFSVKANKDAMEAFHTLNAYIELQLGKQGKYHNIADFGRKATEHAARLAANLAIYEHLESDPMATISDLTMSLSQANRGIELVNQYYLPEYKRLTSANMGIDINREALDLFAEINAEPDKWQSKDKGYISQTIYTQRIGKNVKRSASSNAKIRADAFRLLLEHSYLIPIHYQDSTGRRLTRYQINQAVT